MKTAIQAVAFIIVAAALILGGKNYTNNMDFDRDAQSLSRPEGLQVEVTQEGSGRAAQPGDLVLVHYEGTFTDGRKFDSSYDRGVPFRVILGRNQVIPGFEQGILGMKPGEKRVLTIPPELGYGSEDFSGIPGGSTLKFAIELVGYGEIPQN